MSGKAQVPQEDSFCRYFSISRSHAAESVETLVPLIYWLFHRPSTVASWPLAKGVSFDFLKIQELIVVAVVQLL